MQRRGITRQVILRRVTEALKRLSFGEAGALPRRFPITSALLTIGSASERVSSMLDEAIEEAQHALWPAHERTANTSLLRTMHSAMYSFVATPGQQQG
jgi:hypothetical protein